MGVDRAIPSVCHVMALSDTVHVTALLTVKGQFVTTLILTSFLLT